MLVQEVAFAVTLNSKTAAGVGLWKHSLRVFLHMQLAYLKFSLTESSLHCPKLMNKSFFFKFKAVYPARLVNDEQEWMVMDVGLRKAISYKIRPYWNRYLVLTNSSRLILQFNSKYSLFFTFLNTLNYASTVLVSTKLNIEVMLSYSSLDRLKTQ